MHKHFKQASSFSQFCFPVSQFCFTVIHSNLKRESFVSNYNDGCVFESFLLSNGWGGNLVPNYMTTTLRQTTTTPPNKDTISLVKSKGHCSFISLNTADHQFVVLNWIYKNWIVCTLQITLQVGFFFSNF